VLLTETVIPAQMLAALNAVRHGVVTVSLIQSTVNNVIMEVPMVLSQMLAEATVREHIVVMVLLMTVNNVMTEILLTTTDVLVVVATAVMALLMLVRNVMTELLMITPTLTDVVPTAKSTGVVMVLLITMRSVTLHLLISLIALATVLVLSVVIILYKPTWVRNAIREKTTLTQHSMDALQFVLSIVVVKLPPVLSLTSARSSETG